LKNLGNERPEKEDFIDSGLFGGVGELEGDVELVPVCGRDEIDGVVARLSRGSELSRALLPE
jgi:hypothetical protein